MTIHRPLATSIGLACLVAAATLGVGAQQSSVTPATPTIHAQALRRLLVRNVMVIYGSGRPAFGPADVILEDGRIAYIGAPSSPMARPAEAVIDGTGKYLMPGIVNTHMHWHEERQPGVPEPIQYERNLYLAAGVTTAREVGGDFDKSKRWQLESDAHTIVSPRILVYPVVSKGRTGSAAEIRAWIRDIKERGADGLKIIAMDRDQLEATLAEAHALGLRTTTHIGVEETTAKDYIELGVNAIEHFYGIPDAALDGRQNFPPDMNYNDEVQRFAYAGQLWAQADRRKLSEIVDMMVEHHVGWSPTLSIYEASRDVTRAQNVPWFKDYLHPSMEAYFRPSFDNHGSYFFGWTSTQEAQWRQNYRIWMDTLREFGAKGGLITTGDDAGYIYSLYGFGIARELELQEEAGFQPLEVIEHATWNGARMLGLDDRLGKVREGYVADVLVVNGNPLENLKLLNPYGADVMVVNGKTVPNDTRVGPADRIQASHTGGIEWTIKDGIPYHVPTLLREVRDMVATARRGRTTTP